VATDVDVLVLGGGMAGLSAAAWSVHRGRSVVLVEKGELGGSAARAGFIWTAPTVEALREAIPDGDPQLAERLIEGFGPAVEWVRSMGAEVQPAVTVLRFGRGHQTAILNYFRACELAIRDDPRSDIVMGGDAERLIVENGEVRGAEIRLPDGGVRRIRAAATVLATGGFQGDERLRTELIHAQAHDLPLRSNPYSNGAGLRLGRSAGAAFGPEKAGFYGHLMASGVQLRPDDDFPALTLYYSEHGVLLNLRGERFYDETVGDHLTTMALLEQPEARGLLITDERVREQWILRPYVEGVMAVDTFDLVYKRGARAAVAEDIDELAYLPEEWGYDGETVRQALLDFNRGVTAGAIDPPRAFDATPIDKPPIYVVEVVPAITFTFGGLRVDGDAHVLDEGGRPIRGLFAAGADAGGVYVRAYAGGLAAALVFGLRAAQTALEEAGERPSAGAERGADARAEAAFLPGYFQKLDDGEDIMPMLSPDFTFAILWATDEGAREFAGSFDDWRVYMEQREPEGQRHHISHSLREGNMEVATGWTTRHGDPLGSFTFSVELDAENRARRLFAARTEAFGGVPF
jgi:succinate dehydrogenase/fumarate reductase flavoprotein subunit